MNGNGTHLPVESFRVSWDVDFFNELDRAECGIQTVILGDSPTARASLFQVKSAAVALSLQCSAGGQRQGGIVTNIGQSKRSSKKDPGACYLQHREQG